MFLLLAMFLILSKRTNFSSDLVPIHTLGDTLFHSKACKEDYDAPPIIILSKRNFPPKLIRTAGCSTASYTASISSKYGRFSSGSCKYDIISSRDITVKVDEALPYFKDIWNEERVYVARYLRQEYDRNQSIFIVIGQT